MRIATYRFNGERKVGLVSDNGTTITPFNMAGPDAARGALSIIETLAQGQPSPMAGGPAIVIADVQLEAPLPAARRNLWRSAEGRVGKEGVITGRFRWSPHH